MITSVQEILGVVKNANWEFGLMGKMSLSPGQYVHDISQKELQFTNQQNWEIKSIFINTAMSVETRLFMNSLLKG